MTIIKKCYHINVLQYLYSFNLSRLNSQRINFILYPTNKIMVSINNYSVVQYNRPPNRAGIRGLQSGRPGVGSSTFGWQGQGGPLGGSEGLECTRPRQKYPNSGRITHSLNFMHSSNTSCVLRQCLNEKSPELLSTQFAYCLNSWRHSFLILLRTALEHAVTCLPRLRHGRGSLCSWRQSTNSLFTPSHSLPM